MIKIESIKPLSSSKKIKIDSILLNEYLRRIKNYTSPYKFLSEINQGNNIVVGNTEYNYADFSRNEIDFLNTLYNDFEDLIISQPSILSTYIDNYNNDLLGGMVNRGRFGLQYSSNDFGKKILHIFGYDKNFRSTGYKGIWLAKQLNIKTCPYCNSQFTLVIDGNSNKSQAKFQFDHFFPKKRFPYLSLSFFNLIPSCANCNLAKGEKYFTLEDYYHPYHNSLNEKSVFFADVELDLSKLSIANTDTIKIPIEFKPTSSLHELIVKNHNSVFNLSGVYARMEDEVRRLLKMAIIYNEKKEELLNIKGLFSDEETYLQYLLGSSPKDIDDLLNKPLSKLINDIAKQFGLI